MREGRHRVRTDDSPGGSPRHDGAAPRRRRGGSASWWRGDPTPPSSVRTDDTGSNDWKPVGWLPLYDGPFLSLRPTPPPPPPPRPRPRPKCTTSEIRAGARAGVAFSSSRAARSLSGTARIRSYVVGDTKIVNCRFRSLLKSIESDPSANRLASNFQATPAQSS